jgi:hypothetical protein
MKKVIISLFSVFILFIYPPSASAQNEQYFEQVIKVSPVILNLSLDPGTTQNFPVTVDNLTDQPLPMRVIVSGFDSNDEDHGIKISETMQTSPLQQWIEVDQKEAVIQPKDSRIFNITVNVPKRVDLGGYYAMIFFAPLVINNEMPVNARVGVLALVNLGADDDINNKIFIEQYRFSNLIMENPPLDVLVRVKNTSLNYATIKPVLTIKSVFGPVFEYEMEDKVILPGKIRRWQKSYHPENLNPGIYLSKLSVSTGKGEQINASTHFIVFPWKKALIIGLPTILLLLTIIYRNRVRKALKLLMLGR